MRAMWQGVYGHDDVIKSFRAAQARGRFAGTYLFVGPDGVGKKTLALKLAQALLCSTGRSQLDPCHRCTSCLLAAAGNHPDLELVGRPADRSFIPIETFIGDQEHRLREGLCHRLALKPYLGGHKVALIDDADFMNQEGANCLLKTLEEPPPRSVLILIGTNAARQLPTVRSRCQIIRFAPLALDDVVEILLARQLVSDRQEAARLAEASDGSVARALQLADGTWCPVRRSLLEQLAAPELDNLAAARLINDFVDHAGRDPAARRLRLKQVIELAAAYYRQLMRAASGAPATGAADLEEAVKDTRKTPNSEIASRQLDRCLVALTHVDRNINQATLLECWLDDLDRIAVGAPSG
jgi:DNA polymerase-3 subunit delta'